MELFRGDNITNCTEPGRYRFDGIRSKAFGQGSPNYIEISNLIENIRKHVNPVSVADFSFYHATEFLSFSTSETRAKFWLSSKATVKLIPSTEEYAETRYLFKLHLDDDLLVPLDAGATIYRYDFVCDPELKRPNSNSILEHALMMGTERGSYFKSCPICGLTEARHSIYLIDTVKYLKYYRNSARYDNAIFLAIEDKEWLVIPTDQLTGYSITTIPRAAFWTVEHFITPTEKRSKNLYQILGIEH